MKCLPAEFEGQARSYDEATETWWFSVVDMVQVLAQQPDDLTARKYWSQLMRRLAKEGIQLVTDSHQFEVPATDGKQRQRRVGDLLQALKDQSAASGLCPAHGCTLPAP